MSSPNVINFSWDELIAECEQSLRRGDVAGVGVRLARMASRDIAGRLPRNVRLPLAHLARRAGLVRFGLRVLTPVIHPRNRHAAKATPEEIAEYAVLVQRAGAVREALRWLDKLPIGRVAEAPLYRAFCHFKLWEYEEALTPLREFLAQPPSPYMEIVGQVNLGAALTQLGLFTEASAYLERARRASERSSYGRLEANCLEILAQIHLETGEHDEAERRLARAAKVMGGARSHDQLYILKWQTLLASMRSGNPEALTQLREKAAARNEFETVREADLAFLQLRFDERKFLHLYTGTPFAGYRRRILARLGREAPLVESYVLGEGDGPVLDVHEALLGETAVLRSGKLAHRLLQVLTRDLYRPLNTVELFAEVWPEAAFDVGSSPHRIRQALHRLRGDLASEHIHLEVSSRDEICHVVPAGGLRLRLPVHQSLLDSDEGHLTLIRGGLGSRAEFTAAEAKAWLRMSDAEFKAWAKGAIARGALEKFGAARNTVYQLTSAA